jgi:hypothetical protein
MGQLCQYLSNSFKEIRIGYSRNSARAFFRFIAMPEFYNVRTPASLRITDKLAQQPV